MSGWRTHSGWTSINRPEDHDDKHYDSHDGNPGPQYQYTASSSTAEIQPRVSSTDDAYQSSTTNTFWNVIQTPTVTEAGPSYSQHRNADRLSQPSSYYPNRNTYETMVQTPTVTQASHSHSPHQGIDRRFSQSSYYTGHNPYGSQAGYDPRINTGWQHQNERFSVAEVPNHPRRKNGSWTAQEQEYLVQLFNEDVASEKSLTDFATQMNERFEGTEIDPCLGPRPHRSPGAVYSQRQHPYVRTAYVAWAARKNGRLAPHSSR